MTDAEPPHASAWPKIRETCDRHMPDFLVCMFPWCKCDLAKLQAELDALTTEGAGHGQAT